MIRTLLAVRFKAILSGMFQRKKGGKGTTALLVILFAYVGIVFTGYFGFQFYTLAQVYCPLGLDWLYFAIVGIMSIALCVIGTAFTVQSELYEAKDNDMMLSMPIPFRTILLSRIIPFFVINTLFSALVFLPGIVVYALVTGFSPAVLLQVLSWILAGLPAIGITCLLGWLLHRLMQKINRSVIYVIYTVLFLGIYFYVYTQATSLLGAIATNGQQIASTVHLWIWPLYAMGMGCTGKVLYFLSFAIICVAFMAVTWLLLSVGFRKDTTQVATGKKRKLSLTDVRTLSPVRAIIKKELRRFTGTPIYLANEGIGLLFAAALTVAGTILRGRITEALGSIGIPVSAYPLILCTMFFFLASTACISAPSVSLEGKNIWILQSMPISPVQILQGKLMTHIWLTTPLFFLCGGILGVVYGCTVPGVVLCCLLPAVSTVLVGVFGLWAGLMWPKLDYINEVYPCKQSAAVSVTMLVPMACIVVFGILYALLHSLFSPDVFLAVCGVLLAAVALLLYRRMITWGARKWVTLQ